MSDLSNNSLTRDLEERFGSPVVGAEQLSVFNNGVEIFPAMLEAIEAANREICFETFVYWSGDVAKKFAGGLSDAARRGVKVNVLLDWWGAQEMDAALVEQMRNAGCDIRYFNTLHWWNLRRMNYRTHRKILVVDSHIAFTGGVGIAQEWQGAARNPGEWHDLHYKLTGPAARELRAAFAVLWSEESSSESPAAGAVRAATDIDAGHEACQILCSSPRQGSEQVYQLFRYALQSATRRVQLVTAYFVPDHDTINALKSLIERGVEVEIMLPGEHIDSRVVRYSSRSSWGELLEAGAAIYIYDKTMLHVKAMTIDDKWVIIGSANFDNRSFALNDEVVVSVLSEELATAHNDIFCADLAHCHRVSYEQWRSRGLWARCKEKVSDLLRRHL